MKTRPILFSGPMVLAILKGRKTQTRRVVKDSFNVNGFMDLEFDPLKCPYGQIGDRLWVRETWTWAHPDDNNGIIRYRATSPNLQTRWNPSIHMPRWASRITLEITGVRVERVKEITGADAKAEGVNDCDIFGHDDCFYGASGQGYKCSFQRLWDWINAERGFDWEINPWVWVVEFKRVEP